MNISVAVSNPLTFNPLLTVTLPPTYKLPPIPTPPATCRAPVLVLVEVCVPETNNCVLTVAVPYIIVPDCSFAIVYYLLEIITTNFVR